jgi:hypothetical protein
MPRIDNPNFHGQYYSTEICEESRRHSHSFITNSGDRHTRKPELFSNPMPTPSHSRDKVHVGRPIEQSDTTSIEKSLPWHWFSYIQQRTPRVTINAFASKQNRKLESYWSRQGEPEAQAMDAFPTTLACKRIIPPSTVAVDSESTQEVTGGQVRSAVLLIPTWCTQFW